MTPKWWAYASRGGNRSSRLVVNTSRPSRHPGKLEAPADPADNLGRCIADAFEPDPAGVMLAKDIRPIVQAWLERQGGGKLVENALWAKMRERFEHDPNGGRPHYLDLRARVKSPPKLTAVPPA
jgi:hypothetical protein